jgi:hypothetical protein
LFSNEFQLALYRSIALKQHYNFAFEHNMIR